MGVTRRKRRSRYEGVGSAGEQTHFFEKDNETSK
jgi:hypothetical protein